MLLAFPVLIFGMFGVSLVRGALTGSKTIIGMHTPQNLEIGIYQDSNCSNKTSQIEWGLLEPSTMKDVTVYVRNEGNTNVTLHLLTEDWDPQETSRYISLTWEYCGQSILPGKIVQVVMSLNVSRSVEGIKNFSFDIVITGEA